MQVYHLAAQLLDQPIFDIAAGPLAQHRSSHAGDGSVMLRSVVTGIDGEVS